MITISTQFPPHEIIKAANDLHDWMEKNGVTHLMGIALRRLVPKPKPMTPAEAMRDGELETIARQAALRDIQMRENAEFDFNLPHIIRIGTGKPTEIPLEHHSCITVPDNATEEQCICALIGHSGITQVFLYGDWQSKISPKALKACWQNLCTNHIAPRLFIDGVEVDAEEALK